MVAACPPRAKPLRCVLIAGVTQARHPISLGSALRNGDFVNGPRSSSRASVEPARSEGSQLEPDGSVFIHKLRIPPSELWSSEYRAFQVRLATAASDGSLLSVPARTADKAEWDAFDVWWDRRHHADLLREALARYAVDVQESSIAGVRVGIIVPKEGIAQYNQTRVLLNLHGGGFVYSRGLQLGLLESIPVAAIGRIKLITLDYRQAPFHSYPAASEDVAAVYRELLKTYSPQGIGIFGCSAGGTLTTQALSWFNAASLPRPAAAGIFNIAPMPPGDRPPWGRSWGESSMWFSGVPKDDMSLGDATLWNPVRWYMEKADIADVQAYPGASDETLARFPPTLFVSATRDFAMSSVVYTHARLLKLSVRSHLYIMEGGGHAAHVYALGTPEAHDAQSYIAQWFLQHLA